ncbi:ATP-binding cassette domain-containing protein [Olsenella sp. An293]|uniref:ABC transporter ATP-binding protein n=1 Tax=Olsenella sp. An293 TaxID=1965626 RepID=UPI000B39367C|nr:ATP-binding cassette domain-containing protein [Olsenella sp. An293]OUO32515.1 ABC transporter [Olsenella sp. An293]
MSALEFDHVFFSYAGAASPVLLDASLEVPEGAFALLVGATGSGKSTLLRLAKPEIAPAGELGGSVRVFRTDARELGPQASARAVGHVFQSPDAQIVCDTVWHELAFGLENLGVPEAEMRRRVAETCNFLGIEPWFHARTAELSGGQRQVLALASALAMRPRLLLLDEPTSMLDPLAEKSFLSLLFRANRELGVTVVVATHAPAAMADYATCAFELVEGSVRPASLADLAKGAPLDAGARAAFWRAAEKDVLLAEDVWYRYGRDARWVLRELDLAVGEGEVRAVVGSNGCGKSTLLTLLAGVTRPARGHARNELAASQALLPQSPKALLSGETVEGELMAWSRAGGYGRAEVGAALERLGLAGAAERHPYDLSGGQQQLLALEKLLLVRPRLLLLDEPTKGLDRAERERVARRLAEARDDGATVLLATHDMGFVRAVADRVSLMFDGGIAVTEPTDEYFANSWVFR